MSRIPESSGGYGDSFLLPSPPKGDWAGSWGAPKWSGEGMKGRKEGALPPDSAAISRPHPSLPPRSSLL